MMYHPGQILPPAKPRPLMFDTEIDPTWLIGNVRSGLEAKIRDRFGVYEVDSFFPGRVITRHRHGGRRWDVEQATVTGYVFTHITHLPNVEAMRERIPGFYGFASHSGKLITVTPAKIAELRGLTAAEAALEDQRREAMRVRAGDTATLLEGALKGWTVDVLSIHNGEAIIALAFGGRTKASVASLGRVIPPTEML